MKTYENHEYESAHMNTNRRRAMQAGVPMESKEYDRIEMKNSSGMRVCFEFPKNTELNARVAQEVKAILSDELRDSLRKNVG